MKAALMGALQKLVDDPESDVDEAFVKKAGQVWDVVVPVIVGKGG